MAESILEQEMQIERSGTLTYALRDDAHARNFLQKIGGDEIPVTRVANTPCTLPSVVQKWLGRQRGGSLAILNSHKEVLRPLGVYTIEDFEEAKPALLQLGVNPRDYKGVYSMESALKPSFISYRIVLLAALNSWTIKGEQLSQLMSINCRSLEDLLRMGGCEHLLKLKPVENELKSKPKLEVVPATSASKGDNLLALLSDDAKLMELKGRLQPQLDTLNAQIEKLVAERDEHQKLINRIDLLIGF